MQSIDSMSLSVEERSLIIQLLENRRVYFESRMPDRAREASLLILKLRDKKYA